MNSNGDRDFDADAANGKRLDAAKLAEARLTAYVLGELTDDERATVEKELAESEVVRREVDDIQRSVQMLTAALAAEQRAHSQATGRRRMDEHSRRPPHHNPGGPRPSRPRRRRVGRYLIAASLLVCVALGGGWLLLPHVQSSREVAWQPSATDRSNIVQSVGSYRDSEVSHYKGQAVDIVYPDDAADGDYVPMEQRLRSARTIVGADIQHVTPQAGYANVPSGDASDPQPRFSLRSSAMYKPVDAAKSPDGGSSGQESLMLLNTPRIIIQEEEESLLIGGEQPNTESYHRIDENPFLDVRQNPLSTFSIDVDTASYANLRRFLNAGSLPPKDAVRIEEMLNYFTYHYAPPTDDKPFAVHAEVAGCPWEPKHRLLRIALKGREIDFENRPASNLVFLIDVSGSMDQPAKLPLLKNALRLMIDKLAENDRVAMVVYAGSSGLALPSTSGLSKETIRAALDRLQAGGSTNGGSGIHLAYKVAREGFIKGGTNRVILCTDGDFNVGLTDQGSLTRLIEDEAKSGVFLSVLGFGAGNLKDSTMEQLADRGNGNYAYIDGLQEARKVLVEQLGGTLVTIAKDVKLQLEFNPRQVAAYRLIGYENRLLRVEDFNDDKKDAGEIGAGHTVTALYELVPAGEDAPAAKADKLKYQRVVQPEGDAGDELLTLKLRYKQPDGDASQLIEQVVKNAATSYAKATEDFRFAGAVAGFGLLLRDSRYKGNLTWDALRELAQASLGTDEHGYRHEMLDLVKKAQGIAN